MKKILFALSMLAMVAMVGCKKNKTDEGGITDLQVKPAKATIAEGGQITLTPITQPAGVKGEFTWSSSDTTVAVVDNEGNVYGYNAGVAYITCKEKGGLEAKSEINVTSYLESFTYGQAMVYGWKSADSIGAPIVEVTAQGGEKFNCYFMPINFMVFSEGFYINEDGYYDGADEATVITMPSHFLWGAKELNPGKSGGTIFVLGEWKIEKGASEEQDQTGEPGEYTPAVLTNLLAAVDAYNKQEYSEFAPHLQAAGEATTGTSLNVWSYSCSEEDPTDCGYSYSYVPDAILEDATFYLEGNEGTSGLMVMVDYGKFTFRQLQGGWWGLDADYDEENEQIVVKDRSKLMISEPITMEWGEAPVKEETSAQPRYIQLPESYLDNCAKMQAAIEKQVKEGKLTLKKLH